MGTAIAILATLGALWSFMNLLRPTFKLGMNTRKQAGTMLAFYIILLGIGLAVAPHYSEKDMVDLKTTDPEMYLEVVRRKDGDWAYLTELKVINPERYNNEASAIIEADNRKIATALEEARKENKRTEETKSQVWVANGREAVEYKLKDARSAEFRNLYFSNKGGVPVSCGEVNSKNSFGGYVGFQRFISGGSSDTTFLEEEVAEFPTLWNRLC